MKKHTLVGVILFVSTIYTLSAQHKGNYNQITPEISRQNILTSGNANIYNPTI